jgi:hypothetical protein
MPTVASNATPKLVSNPIGLFERRPDDASSVQHSIAFSSTRSRSRGQRDKSECYYETKKGWRSISQEQAKRLAAINSVQPIQPAINLRR